MLQKTRLDRLANDYWQKGYVVVKDILTTTEVVELQAECDRLLRRDDLFIQRIPEAQLRQDKQGRPIRDRLDPVFPYSSKLRALTDKSSLQDILKAILNDSAILFKDKLIFKPPGVTGYELHQDYAYWRHLDLPADSLLSVQIAIDSADEQNGAIVLYPGLHHSSLPAPSDSHRDVCPSAVKAYAEEVICTNPGDVLIFHSLTPHFSGSNRSGGYRRTLYLPYNAGKHGDLYKTYYGDRLHS